jgi:6-phosphogluconolactonase
MDVLYFSNEQGCSVSGYRLDTGAGTLSLFQTITTLPPEGFAERNTCSQIQITGAGGFLYAPNRGHDSIACYTVDAATGELTGNGIVASEARPNALCLGPGDRYIYSAGQDSGQMAIFSVNPDSGSLTLSETVPLGNGPCWISIVELPG